MVFKDVYYPGFQTVKHIMSINSSFLEGRPYFIQNSIPDFFHLNPLITVKKIFLMKADCRSVFNFYDSDLKGRTVLPVLFFQDILICDNGFYRNQKKLRQP